MSKYDIVVNIWQSLKSVFKKNKNTNKIKVTFNFKHVLLLYGQRSITGIVQITIEIKIKLNL